MNSKAPATALQHSQSHITTLLKGVGQIMLQENAVTGLLFLAGIFYGSVFMGLATILAVLCGTLTAYLLKYDKTAIQKGLYGFSPALVGVALIFYFQPVVATWLAIIAGSVIAAMLQHWFIKKQVPVFTLPFILVTWVVLYLFNNLYPVAAAVSVDTPVTTGQDFAFAFRGFGEVIFQGTVFAGIAFFAGIFINAPVAALYSLAAAVLAAVMSSALGAPATAIDMGLFSYNAVLCAIVFAGTKKEDGIWVFIVTLLSVVISLVMDSYHLTPLTFPFVLASWITLLLKYSAKKFISREPAES